MPTPLRTARLGDDLLDGARRILGLPPDTPASEIIRAALRRITGDPDATGEPVSRGGRPPKIPR